MRITHGLFKSTTLLAFGFAGFVNPLYRKLPAKLKEDFDIAYKAAKETCDIIRLYADFPDSIKNNKKITLLCLKAGEYVNPLYRAFPASLKEDFDIACKSAEQTCDIISLYEEFPDPIKNNKKLIFLLLEIGEYVNSLYRMLPARLKEDFDIACKAAKQTCDIISLYEEFPDPIRNNKQVIMLCLEKDRSSYFRNFYSKMTISLQQDNDIVDHIWRHTSTDEKFSFYCDFPDQIKLNSRYAIDAVRLIRKPDIFLIKIFESLPFSIKINNEVILIFMSKFHDQEIFFESLSSLFSNKNKNDFLEVFYVLYAYKNNNCESYKNITKIVKRHLSISVSELISNNMHTIIRPIYEYYKSSRNDMALFEINEDMGKVEEETEDEGYEVTHDMSSVNNGKPCYYTEFIKTGERVVGYKRYRYLVKKDFVDVLEGIFEESISDDLRLQITREASCWGKPLHQAFYE